MATTKFIYSSRHTGWQCVFGLRGDRIVLQSELGCLDAPLSMPAGSIREVEKRTASSYWATERHFLRGE